MTRCRWDRDQEAYLHDDEPCLTDPYGDPTYHCHTRRSCGRHIGPGELTCTRCLGRTRGDLRRITTIAPLLLTQALGKGVRSDAAYLAGPATDTEQWTWRKTTARAGGPWHASLPPALGGDPKHVEDDDDRHPFSVLTRWEYMLREAYHQPHPGTPDLISTGQYLDRTLHRLAQDGDQDFPAFAREIRACRETLEAVIGNSSKPDSGAPCPDCKNAGHVVRLQREYGHRRQDPDCDRLFHHRDDTGDRWVCPRDRDHWRSHADYTRFVEERRHTTSA